MLPFSFSQGLHLAQKESQDFALELETETELGLEAKLPVEYELELVDNFHDIHFLVVFSIFTMTTFTNLDLMHFYIRARMAPAEGCWVGLWLITWAFGPCTLAFGPIIFFNPQRIIS